MTALQIYALFVLPALMLGIGYGALKLVDRDARR
jgi:hypothetical protein